MEISIAVNSHLLSIVHKLKAGVTMLDVGQSLGMMGFTA